MVVVVGDSRSKGHRSRHPDLGQGHHGRLLFVWRNNMAHDATFVTSIRQVRDEVLSLICDGNVLRSEIID